jgi:translocator protein
MNKAAVSAAAGALLYTGGGFLSASSCLRTVPRRPFQPTSSVFPAVWGTLFLLSGLAAGVAAARRQWVLLGLFVLLFVFEVAWSPVYCSHPDKRWAAWLIIPIIALALGVAVHGDAGGLAKAAGVSTVAWCVFAQQLLTTGPVRIS